MASASWGTGIWAFLHTVTIVPYSTAWEAVSRQGALVKHIYALADVLPCASCRVHYLEMLRQHPPEVAAQRPRGLFEWTVMIHNIVNMRLGMPPWTLDAALRRWEGGSLPP